MEFERNQHEEPLHLVGRSKDGESLHLEDSDGERYLLQIDEKLKNTVNAPVLMLTRFDDEPQGPPTPREIQTLLRAGHSVAAISKMREIEIEKVERFAGPVLRERSHMALQALNTLVRRDRSSEGRSLKTLVIDRLGQGGVDEESLEWDSWRREDGSWTVALRYPTRDGEGAAHWILDPTRRILTADDEGARWLTGDERVPQEKVADRIEAKDAPRLQAIRSTDGVDAKATRDGVTKRAAVPSWDDIMFGVKRDD
ncbi:MAG TPA: septation protein SepH [Candidatus Nanopelagicaceae bacterium]|nr:septation protein SepH [Candidatus Nanopelagicaceae bacterium]